MMGLHQVIFLPNNRILGKKYSDSVRVIPIFITHMGCPNRCVFCDQEHISGSAENMTPAKAREICDKILYENRENKVKFECAFYGGSFTGIGLDLMEEFLKIPFERDLPIRLSTRPDYINKEILDLLLRYNVSTIELGVQSMDDNVLNLSKRNHTSYDTVIASKLIRDFGFLLGIQTMTGLPGDTNETAIETAKKICKIKPDFVRIYPTLVIKGTELSHLYDCGKYVPATLEDSISLCADLLDIYDSAGIKVIRLGLQSSTDISRESESKVLAGPYHSAFRQLTESFLLAKKISEIPVFAIECGRDSAQYLKGHGNFGLRLIQNQMGNAADKKIIFNISSELPPNIINVFSGSHADSISVML